MITPTTSGILREYQRFLSCEIGVDELITFCRTGSFRTAATRSIAWRILLKCLPINSLEWVPVIEQSRREYATLRSRHVANPRDPLCVQDPQLNNPLSEHSKSPWSRYFADGELRDLILKDVARTFPEIELFQDAEVKSLMCSVLHVYAKDNPFIGYKQGMHEILAPLVFVLYNDQQLYQHALEDFQLRSLDRTALHILQVLHDSNYFEADAYVLFCEVMRELTPWYEDAGIVEPPEPHPFERLQDTMITSRLLKELNEIGQRLAEFDPPLYRHLTNLDIPAQLFGIRWLRLLFGREFPLPDLLFLWDIILSDRPISRIVECVFLAMLVYIRENLLASDYGGCLQFLMRYPPVVDVMAFAQLALHFRAPLRNSRPKDSQLTNYSNMTLQGTVHPNAGNQKRTVSQPPPQQRSQQANRGKQRRPYRQEEIPKALGIFEEQVAVLQQRLNERDIVTAVSAKRIEELVKNLERGSLEIGTIAAQLREVGQQLGSLTMDRRKETPEAKSPAQEERIKVANEPVRSGTPRIFGVNELRELNTNNQNFSHSKPPSQQVPRDRVLGIPRF
ncbi:unnamed protein product, partial [Mesorhabditis belari]|uniref:Rab-GAP TBC domain-containing protein n=1 Tax=Mesorhabditis belari TaxID=2138241 RepID=A0AAF3E9P5_9BILA